VVNKDYHNTGMHFN